MWKRKNFLWVMFVKAFFFNDGLGLDQLQSYNPPKFEREAFLWTPCRHAETTDHCWVKLISALQNIEQTKEKAPPGASLTMSYDPGEQHFYFPHNHNMCSNNKGRLISFFQVIIQPDLVMSNGVNFHSAFNKIISVEKLFRVKWVQTNGWDNTN